MWWKDRRQRPGDRRGRAVADDQKASFTSRGFWRGVRLGLPFAATSLVHGLLFGVVALEAELAVWDAVMMSSLVASGSAQFAAMEIWGRPLAVGALATVTLLVNLRYVLLGSTLPALFATLSPLQRYSGAYFLSDESWAITMQDFQAGFTDAAVLVGSGAAVYSGWILGTGTGFVFAPESLRSLPGLGFVVTALLITVLTGFWRGASMSLVPWAVAAVAALATFHVLPGTWYVLVGGGAGALVGVWVDGP